LSGSADRFAFSAARGGPTGLPNRGRQHESDRQPLSSGPVALGLLLLVSFGCKADDGHRNMGATVSVANSSLNYWTKPVGVLVVSVGDAVFSPLTMASDQMASKKYHKDHKWFSYAGSRTIARSDMGLEYQAIASIPTIIIETILLPITGTIDVIYAMNTGGDDDDDDDDDDEYEYEYEHDDDDDD
jgi:hypothetical protein